MPPRLHRCVLSNRALRTAAALAAALVLAACGGGDSAPPAEAPPPAANVLNVTLGISAVSKTPAASLDAFADADPTGMVFAAWTGDTSVLLTPGERRSAVGVVTGTKNIAATYKPLASFMPSSAVLNGVAATDPSAVNAYWFFPAVPLRGIVFRFHGAGGNGSTQFSKVEEGKFMRDAVAGGFAVVSLDSVDRVNKTWDPTTVVANPAANADVRNIQQLIAALTTQGLMTAATPLFASGHSDGAGAALRFAFLLGWKASHQSCVPGVAQIAQATTVPGIWTMAQNDNIEDPQRDAKALDNSNALAARGIVSQYILVAPSAVYPGRFTQIAGLTKADSQAIYNSLKAASLLDANDYQVRDPNLVDFVAVIPAAYQSFGKDIVDQLFVAYTAHKFSSATNRRVLAFFEARL